jgi:O-methyltransferase
MNTTSLYLNLIKRVLSDTLRDDFDPRVEDGRGWPPVGYTMIGFKRLDNLQMCVEQVLREGIPGDFIETGVWRGGATIFMRALLAAYGDTTRRVWVADSFAGMPKPDPDKHPADQGDIHHEFNALLAVSLEQVQANFARFDLLDDQVVFLKGWFRDTLPTAPVEQLAVLRIDGDMYESTMDALVNLYPKLSVGGYAIIDDYGYIKSCRQAVEDYRLLYGIRDEIIEIDWTGVYWRRTC